MLHGLAQCFPHGDNHGTALEIDQADEKSGRITVTLSLLELDGTGLQGQFDARVPICATEENCAKPVEGRLQSLGFAVEGKMHPAHQVEEESPFVQTLLRCYEECTGKPGRCVAMGGGTYVHDIPGGVAFGMGDFDFDSRLHGANERARVFRPADRGENLRQCYRSRLRRLICAMIPHNHARERNFAMVTQVAEHIYRIPCPCRGIR